MMMKQATREAETEPISNLENFVCLSFAKLFQQERSNVDYVLHFST